MGVLVGRRGQQVHVAKRRIGSVGRVAAVEQGLHLTSHLEEVDGRGERDGVGRHDALHDGGRIVVQRACGAGLASQASAAELDALAAQADRLHVVTCLARPFGEREREGVRVAGRAQAGRYH